MNAPVVLPHEALQAEHLRIQGDGVELAAYRWGKTDGPTLLLVHGYPDSHEVWLPLVRELAANYQIIAYDVRGFGASDISRNRLDYHLAKLANDLEAVTEPRIQPLLASYTSISGPCLDHVGHWMRDKLKQKRPRALLQVLGQLLSSWYIALFHTPWLPELTWRLGLDRAWPSLLRRVEGLRNVAVSSSQRSDGVHGVKLYRANFIRSLFTPRLRHTDVPVQLIVPTEDRFVRPQLFDHLQHWAPKLWRREVRAGHWQLLAEPQQLALWLREFIQHLQGDGSSRALQQAQVKANAGPYSGKLVIVTGAGSGIGRATLLEFAKQGANVLAADINLAAAEQSAELAKAVGSEAFTYQLDVGDSKAMATFAARVEREFGSPDIVINNAGIGMAGSMLDTSNADWERLLRWHGAEEVEHRSVAHDLHVHIGGSVMMRWVYMLITTPALIFLFSSGMKTMMRQDPVTRYRPGFLYLWYQLGKRGLLPRMGSIGRSVLRYFKPGYHPRTEGDIRVALDYLASSPAAQRAAAEKGAVSA